MALSALLLLPAVLWAHTKLLSSKPANGATIGTPPSSIRLVFSERAALAMTSVRLVSGPDTTNLTPLALDPENPSEIVAPISGSLRAGVYTVLWRVAGRDGHPIRGTVSFTVAGASGSTVDTTSAAPAGALAQNVQVEGVGIALGGAIGFILVRWLAFVSIFFLVGAVVFRHFVVARAAPLESDVFGRIASTNSASLGMAAAVALALTAILKLGRESSDMPDVPITGLLFGSMWGTALFAQLLLALVAVAAFRAAHSDSNSTRNAGWKLALAASVAAAVMPAFGGHAIAGENAFLAVSADIVHIIAGSAWLGTLAVIVIVGIPAALKSPDEIRPGARVASLVNTFSPLALLSGGSVVATGLGSSVMRLPGVDSLWTTPYGVALLLKVIFVAMLFAAGAWNWRRMKPRLTGDDAIGPLRSSASLELVLAGTVLGLTAILVALALP